MISFEGYIAMKCPNKSMNMEGCNCTYTGCDKAGICCECVRYHRKKGQIPACFFPAEAEKTFNRSIDYFTELHQPARHSSS